MASDLFSVHSQCCNAHWKLVCDNDEYDLRCEKCGLPIGGYVRITVGELKGIFCKDVKARSERS